MATTNKMVCRCVLDCVAMGALVQRKEVPVEESTEIRPCIGVGFELLEGKRRVLRGEEGAEKSQKADLRP